MCYLFPDVSGTLDDIAELRAVDLHALFDHVHRRDHRVMRHRCSRATHGVRQQVVPRLVPARLPLHVLHSNRRKMPPATQAAARRTSKVAKETACEGMAPVAAWERAGSRASMTALIKEEAYRQR